MSDDAFARQPRSLVWLLDRRLAVAERLGGGGRSHRRERRIAEQTWCRANGITDVVSGMTTRHGLLDYALGGLGVHHYPLSGADIGAPLGRMVHAVERLLAQDHVVLVHVDRANGWLAGVDAALRRGLGLAGDADEALLQAARDGLPLDDDAERLVNQYVQAAGGVKLP
jgi:hypothetical protein